MLLHVKVTSQGIPLHSMGYDMTTPLEHTTNFMVEGSHDADQFRLPISGNQVRLV